MIHRRWTAGSILVMLLALLVLAPGTPDNQATAAAQLQGDEVEVVFRGIDPTEGTLDPELEAEDFACDDIVTFVNIVVVTADDAVNETLSLINVFASQSSNERQFGFTRPLNIDITSLTWITDTGTPIASVVTATRGDQVTGTAVRVRTTLSGLDADDVVAISYNLLLTCGPDAAEATGNVQSRLTGGGLPQEIVLLQIQGRRDSQARPCRELQCLPCATDEARCRPRRGRPPSPLITR